MTSKQLTALAIVAHPDDVEFFMAGTLLLLKDAGVDIHLWNLCSGCYGSMVHSYDDIKRIRLAEAEAAAHSVGAQILPPIADDLTLFYDAPTIARVSAGIRRVRPDIILTHPPLDYMEDHMTTCRLAVTAAFTREMPNYTSQPAEQPYAGEVVIYHSMPAGLKTGLREPVESELYVDVGSVLARKRAMLAHHESQNQWLDATQGMNSYLNSMEDMTRQMGTLSGAFEAAEGWRRHLHLGFAAEDADPISDVLGARVIRNPGYVERQRS
jgi:LmbE family N-acetylglucosaminyl deacetylase